MEHRSPAHPAPRPTIPALPATGLALLAAVLLAAPAAASGCIPIPVPVVLTQPGLYCLDQDHDVTITTGSAIRVDSDDVTVDFRGHAIRNHAPQPFTSGYPVGVQSLERSRIVVRNGIVSGFREGISLSQPFGASTSYGHLVEDMRVFDSQRIGIGIGGHRSIVRRNVVDRVTGSKELDVTGIWVAGGINRVLDNDVSLVTGEEDNWGIRFLDGVDGIAVGNRLTATGGGILMEDTGTAYRDNFVLQIPAGRAHFLGGIDAGGNFGN